MAEIEHPER
jgi:hypothetical protein